MKKLLALAIVTIAGIGLMAAKATNVSCTYNNLATFDKLEISTGGDVKYTIGDIRTVSITVDEKYASEFEVSVKGGTLYVGLKQGTRNFTGNDFEVLKKSGFKVVITGPALKGITANIGSDVTVISPFTVPGGSLKIEVTTGAEVEFNGAVSCRSLNAEVNTSGELEMDALNATTVKAAVSCGGTIDLSGLADTVTYEVSVGGNIKAAGLKAAKGSANVSMGGSIKCNVGSLSKETTMGGSIVNTNK